MRKEAECTKATEVFEDFGRGPCAPWRRVAWDIMEKPETSRLARVRLNNIYVTSFILQK